MEQKNKKDPETGRDPSQLNEVERFYEHFRGVPLKYLDIFIGVCMAGLILVVVLGILKGRGIL